MELIFRIKAFLSLFILITILGVKLISGLDVKGDSGHMLDLHRHSIMKRSENSYRYYGTGSKGSSSLVPTSPSKPSSHFTSDDAFGGGGYRSTYFNKPTKNSVQDLTNFLQFYDTSATDNLPADFGEMASASGHGHGHSSGYGHGGGGGHGKGCNSALGLLGVLGLAAYLQNVLQQMNANATGRRRRSVVNEQMIKMTDAELKQFLAGNDSTIESSKPQKVITGLLPVLSAVAHARDGLIPITCTYRQLCHANEFLVQSVGSVGRSLGALLSSEIGKLLMEVDRRRAPIILKSINKVAQLGRSGHDCDSLFQDCEALKYLPIYSMPPNSRFSRFPHRILQIPSSISY